MAGPLLHLVLGARRFERSACRIRDRPWSTGVITVAEDLVHQPVIVNQRTGQRMRFIDRDGDGKDAAVAVGRRAVLRIESWSPPSEEREPNHVHPEQESRFEMLSGELAFWVDGKEFRAGPGETVTVPAATTHRFWNPTDTEAHYVQVWHPALDTRHLFEVLFRLANEGKLDKRGMPGPLLMPVLVRTFHHEIRPSSPPWLVTRLAAAALTPLAALRGYRRLEDL